MTLNSIRSGGPLNINISCDTTNKTYSPYSYFRSVNPIFAILEIRLSAELYGAKAELQRIMSPWITVLSFLVSGESQGSLTLEIQGHCERWNEARKTIQSVVTRKLHSLIPPAPNYLHLLQILHRPAFNTLSQHTAKQICQRQIRPQQLPPNYQGNKVNSRENTSKKNVPLAVTCCARTAFSVFSMGPGLWDNLPK